MGISSTHNQHEKKLTINVSERFDFSLHQAFRDSYQHIDQPGTSFRLDLSKANYMDSSALGMILLLKDHAEKLKGRVVIERPNQAVSKILEIAQFQHLMTIVS